MPPTCGGGGSRGGAAVCPLRDETDGRALTGSASSHSAAHPSRIDVYITSELRFPPDGCARAGVVRPPKTRLVVEDLNERRETMPQAGRGGGFGRRRLTAWGPTARH